MPYIFGMSGSIRLKENYVLAKCCLPTQADKIIGYYSHENYLKVHRHDCPHLKKVDAERLVSLNWEDIIETDPFIPDEDFDELDEVDLAILAHHDEFGMDYSLMVAKVLHLPKEEVFRRHTTLRTNGFLRRVEPRIIQYRKGIVDNKWIKHRNHTYYELTKKGTNCLASYRHRQKDKT